MNRLKVIKNYISIVLIILLCLNGCFLKAPSDESEVNSGNDMTPVISTQDNSSLTDATISDAILSNKSDSDSSSASDADETVEVKNPREDILISIDPGHQSEKVDMSAPEPVAPSSSETKAKATGGTKGRFTGVPEYQLNLDISLKLRDSLELLGYKVIMTREDNETAISNKERACLANDSGADISIRIHANGSDDSSASGALTMVGSQNNPDVGYLYEDSYRLAECVLDEYCSNTGMASQGVVTTDNMTGINWSKIPVIILEMGFMTNQGDDTNMQDPVYQEKMVKGIVNGVERYYDFDGSGLKEDIKSVLSDVETSGAACSVYLKNLSTGLTVEYYSDSNIDISAGKQRAASVIKLYIAGCVFENIDDLKTLGYTDTETDSLVKKMISESDNDATNDLVKMLGASDAASGMKKINSYIESLGFADSEMGRLMLDFDSENDNYINASETGQYLEMLYNGKVKGSDRIIEYMMQQERRNKIPAGIPSGITVANKTGELEDVEHDAAIVYGEKSNFIIVVLISNLSDTASGREAITSLSDLTYKRWE